LTEGGDGNGAKYGKDNVRATAVRALDVTTIIEYRFDTIKEAAEFCMVNATQISAIIKNVMTENFEDETSCWLANKKFTFQKYDPKDPYKPFDISKLRTKEEHSAFLSSRKSYCSKAVIGTHHTGFSVEFNTTHEAERVLKLRHGYVSRNARGLLGPVEGFTWVFKDINEREKYPVWVPADRVGAPGVSVFRIKNDEKIEFKSIKDAIKATKITRKMINKYIDKKLEDIDGYLWFRL
jgi:hypothetical protein